MRALKDESRPLEDKRKYFFFCKWTFLLYFIVNILYFECITEFRILH